MSQNKHYQKIEVNKALLMDPDDDPNCLLGRRFLCRGSGGMIIGESGAGKSSFALQFACYLAVGKSFFGIKHPTGKELQVLLVQAENDALEVAEVLKSIVDAEGWDAKKQAMLHKNLHIYCSWDEGGGKFAQWLGQLVKDHKIDIAIIDPLMSFCGCDVTNNKEMGKFLRQDINSQLKAQHPSNPKLMNFGLIVIHHTGKKGGRQGNSDEVSSYDMMGASELTNWARFVMHLNSSKLSTTDQRVFDVSISKRGNRSGVNNEGRLGEHRWAVQYSSKKGIKPVAGNIPKAKSGTGLNWIHWEKYSPSNGLPSAPSAIKPRIRPPNPRTIAGRAAKTAATVATSAGNSAKVSATSTTTKT